MKRVLVVLLAVALAATAWAEVWNDPSGLTVNSTSQTVVFPRNFSSVMVLNDSTADSVYVRVFSDVDVPAPATSTNLEIKPGTWRGFAFDSRTETGTGYRSISLVGPAGGATVRLEGK